MKSRIAGARAAMALGAMSVFLAAGLCALPPSETPATPQVPAVSSTSSSSDEDIRDIRGPRNVMPGWILAALAAGVGLLALSIYLYWRRRRNRRVRILLPYEVALQRLEDIRALMQPSRAREFSTAVSDVVRNYIEQRFEVAVTRRTTEEFLRDLVEFPVPSLGRHQSLLSNFLQQCDLVKFAAMSLASQSMESLHHSARTFVLATVKTEEVSSVKVAGDSLPIS
ncbi:MAG: hypothetical protein QOK23_389 [Gammaproteobacteria bacterium]|jgi:hypothetical protein|nr:hypothetical protein [Gammaproteobacteria bacterium]MEA3138220.1 hypothetical protein [Gammaproteobacteria bacterium]